MRLVRRLLGLREEVPSWASKFPLESFVRFVVLVRRKLDAGGREYELNEEAGCFRFTDTPGAEFGLAGLGEKCLYNGGRDWVELISEHVDAIRAISVGGYETPVDFASAKPLLRITPASPNTDIDGIVTMKVSASLSFCLVLDYPEYSASVTSPEFERWGVSEQAAFHEASENLWRDGRREAAEYRSSDSESVFVVHDMEYRYVASHALFLNRYMVDEPDDGALLALPNRHTMTFSPIRATPRSESLRMLARLAESGFASGPGPVSPQVFWWRDGSFTGLVVEATHGEARIVGPDSVLGSVLMP
jgi:hypothetical protein